MTITLEAVGLPESGLFELNIHQTVDIQVNAATARRRVTRYVAHIPHLKTMLLNN